MIINSDRTVTLGTRTCYSCNGSTTRPGYMNCPHCKGTKRGPRGGKDSCRKCFGGQVHDVANQVTCDCCNGKGVTNETIGEYMTTEFQTDVYNMIPILVGGQNRPGSWNETYIGIGCIYSCTDYGTAWDGMVSNPTETKAGLIESVKRHHANLNNIAREVDGKIVICDEIYVVVHHNGYSVRASYMLNGADVISKIKQEPSERNGTIIGTQVHKNGGNGTMAAAGM